MAGEAFHFYLGARKTMYLDDESAGSLLLHNGSKWVAEPKIDGQWCCVFIKDCKVDKIISRWGKEKDDSTVDGLIGLPTGSVESAVLIGELEAGTQVAVGMFGKFGYRRVHLFDVVQLCGGPTARFPYTTRRELLEDVFWKMPETTREQLLLVRSFKGEDTDFAELFREVIANGGEGLMLKEKDSIYMPDNPTSKSRKFGKWMKAKKVLTKEFVVVREVAAEKGGRGAKLGLFVGGKLKEVMQMQLPPAVLDRCHAEGLFKKMVIEAKGNEEFKSGAIRHANFLRVREGRPPESCK